jgi:nicotinamide mononucleotide transporter
MAVLSAACLIAAVAGWLPFSLTETLGFVTGAVCVYLVVKEHIWNYPIGLANSLFFLVLFAEKRIYGDAGLQIVYVILGIHGWYSWLHGGAQRQALRIERASLKVLAISIGVVPPLTWILKEILQGVNGSAPWLDSFTTVVSLVAQFLLNRKYIENWLFWIVADVIYVSLYIIRDLKLTAVLYFVFLILAVAGYINWYRLSHQAGEAPEVLEPSVI